MKYIDKVLKYPELVTIIESLGYSAHKITPDQLQRLAVVEEKAEHDFVWSQQDEKLVSDDFYQFNRIREAKNSVKDAGHKLGWPLSMQALAKEYVTNAAKFYKINQE